LERRGFNPPSYRFLPCLLTATYLLARQYKKYSIFCIGKSFLIFQKQ
jgi:hypothetical protein